MKVAEEVDANKIKRALIGSTGSLSLSSP